MDGEFVLGIDCGTSQAKVMAVDRDGITAGFETAELGILRPGAGFAEQDPLEVWEIIHGLIRKVLSRNGIMPRQIAALGIANQRASTVMWNKKTGIPYCNAVLWIDKRAVSLASQFSRNMDSWAVERTGMYTIPNTSAMLLTWLLRNDERVMEGAARGEALFGTFNTWLLWKLTGGMAHCSDFTNMSITQLQNVKELDYDREVLRHLGIPESILPELGGPGRIYGMTHEGLFSGMKIPVAGMLGDQMAAALGQGCIRKGMVKVTYGTGCFCVMNTGNDYIPPSNGLFSPILWGRRGETAYSLEGFFEINTSDVDREGVDGIVSQTAGIIRAMEKLSGQDINILRVDGGMSRMDLLNQSLADALGIPVERPAVSEATVLGAIYQAGLTVGFWDSLEETASLWKLDKRFEPAISGPERSSSGQGSSTVNEIKCGGEADE